MTVVERFMSKVVVKGLFTHWIWDGARNGKGYGSFWLAGKARGAHCVAWELFVGAIPHGMHVDHTCEFIHCVNPAHLQIVTLHENVHFQNHGRLVPCFVQPWFEPLLQGWEAA